MAKRRVALVGAGKIGEAIVTLFKNTPDYDVTVIEQDAARLVAFARAGLSTHHAVLRSDAALSPLIAGHDAGISACPFQLTPLIARAARAAGAHCVYPAEDVENTV